jgi:hypothetical protein
MCRVCEGNPPDPLAFRDFEMKILQALSDVKSQDTFLQQAIAMDKIRFKTSVEWGEPHIFNSVRRLIFTNPDPDEGLLLFTLGCWLDMQAQFTTVWTTYLSQAKNWMNNKGPLPRGNFTHTTPHLLLTRESLKRYGTISQWFVQKINRVAENHGQKKGNIYRLAGELCTELYSKSQVANSLNKGLLPTDFSGGDHKRFWMFMMFLRRDNNMLRCLFERALTNKPKGRKAVEYWYDPAYFNPIECELPVDRRVLSNWNQVTARFEKSKSPLNRPEIANKARLLAQKQGVSPSVFDALLFYSG